MSLLKPFDCQTYTFLRESLLTAFDFLAIYWASSHTPRWLSMVQNFLYSFFLFWWFFLDGAWLISGHHNCWWVSSNTHSRQKQSGHSGLSTVPSMTGPSETGAASDILRSSSGSQSQPLYANRAAIAASFSSDKFPVTLVAISWRKVTIKFQSISNTAFLWRLISSL